MLTSLSIQTTPSALCPPITIALSASMAMETTFDLGLAILSISATFVTVRLLAERPNEE